MVRRNEPDLESAHRSNGFRRRALAVLAFPAIALIAINLVLLLGFDPWMAFQHKTSLDHAPAGPSTVWPSIDSTGPLLQQRLAAARTMLATGDLRGAQHEYLMILLSVAPDSAEAWRGLVALHRRWAAENPAKLSQQVKAYRLAIRNGTEMSEHYSPQALQVLAKAAMFAAEEIEGTRRQLQVATSRPTLNEHTGIVRLAREVLGAPIVAYVVNVGDFASPTMADRMMHLIRSKGYIVEVARRGRVSEVVTRPYRTRRQAEYMVHGLEALRLPATLMARQLSSQQ